MKRRGYKPPRRVWYIHHAESEGLFKTYDRNLLQQAEREQCDIINNEIHNKWKKTYGQENDKVYENTPSPPDNWDDDIPF